MNVILETPTHKVESAGVISLKRVMSVSPKDLVLLFPDEALAELDDLATDKTEPKSDRGKARKVLTILSGSEPIDVTNEGFTALMSWATVLESFSETDVDNINNALGA